MKMILYFCIGLSASLSSNATGAPATVAPAPASSAPVTPPTQLIWGLILPFLGVFVLAALLSIVLYLTDKDARQPTRAATTTSYGDTLRTQHHVPVRNVLPHASKYASSDPQPAPHPPLPPPPRDTTPQEEIPMVMLRPSVDQGHRSPTRQPTPPLVRQFVAVPAVTLVADDTDDVSFPAPLLGTESMGATGTFAPAPDAPRAPLRAEALLQQRVATSAAAAAALAMPRGRGNSRSSSCSGCSSMMGPAQGRSASAGATGPYPPQQALQQQQQRQQQLQQQQQLQEQQKKQRKQQQQPRQRVRFASGSAGSSSSSGASGGAGHASDPATATRPRRPRSPPACTADPPASRRSSGDGASARPAAETAVPEAISEAISAVHAHAFTVPPGAAVVVAPVAVHPPRTARAASAGGGAAPWALAMDTERAEAMSQASSLPTGGSMHGLSRAEYWRLMGPADGEEGVGGADSELDRVEQSLRAKEIADFDAHVAALKATRGAARTARR